MPCVIAKEGLPIFKVPQRLVITTHEGKLQEDMQVIEQIKQLDRPLVPIAIGGQYRTGKSFLLNSIMHRASMSPSTSPDGANAQSKSKTEGELSSES